MMNASALLNYLLLIHAPIFHFHEKEAYYPTSVDRVFDALYSNQNLVAANKTMPWAWRLYGSAVTTNDPTRVKLWYALLYEQNQEKGHVDYHPGDLEYIIMFIDTREPLVRQSVFLSAHSIQQGTWLRQPTTDKLHVFVARGSHAMYSKPGIYQRIFSLFNDDCSMPTIKWNPSGKIEIISEQWWTKYPGLLLGVASLPNAHYADFMDVESMHAYGSSWVYRFFYPLFYAFDST
jgi:hypothetical protein